MNPMLPRRPRPPTTKKAKITVPLPSRPADYVPGSGPPLASLYLQPPADSTAYIDDRILLPPAGVGADGRPLPKRMRYLVGWRDLPAARLLVPAMDILQYVSPHALEEWEYQMELELDEERARLADARRARQQQQQMVLSPEQQQLQHQQQEPEKKKRRRAAHPPLHHTEIETAVVAETEDSDRAHRERLRGGAMSLSTPKKRKMDDFLDGYTSNESPSEQLRLDLAQSQRSADEALSLGEKRDGSATAHTAPLVPMAPMAPVLPTMIDDDSHDESQPLHKPALATKITIPMMTASVGMGSALSWSESSASPFPMGKASSWEPDRSKFRKTDKQSPREQARQPSERDRSAPRELDGLRPRESDRNRPREQVYKLRPEERERSRLQDLDSTPRPRRQDRASLREQESRFNPRDNLNSRGSDKPRLREQDSESSLRDRESSRLRDPDSTPRPRDQYRTRPREQESSSRPRETKVPLPRQAESPRARDHESGSRPRETAVPLPRPLGGSRMQEQKSGERPRETKVPLPWQLQSQFLWETHKRTPREQDRARALDANRPRRADQERPRPRSDKPRPQELGSLRPPRHQDKPRPRQFDAPAAGAPRVPNPLQRQASDPARPRHPDKLSTPVNTHSPRPIPEQSCSSTSAPRSNTHNTPKPLAQRPAERLPPPAPHAGSSQLGPQAKPKYRPHVAQKKQSPTSSASRPKPNPAPIFADSSSSEDDDEDDEEQAWDVERLEDMELYDVEGRGLIRYFQVRWVGDWPPDQNPTWEPEENIPADLIREFCRTFKGRPTAKGTSSSSSSSSRRQSASVAAADVELPPLRPSFSKDDDDDDDDDDEAASAHSGLFVYSSDDGIEKHTWNAPNEHGFRPNLNMVFPAPME